MMDQEIPREPGSGDYGAERPSRRSPRLCVGGKCVWEVNQKLSGTAVFLSNCCLRSRLPVRCFS